MSNILLSWNTRKSLCNHLTEAAGAELAGVLEALAARIEELERSKVDVTYIVPPGRPQGGPAKSAPARRWKSS